MHTRIRVRFKLEKPRGEMGMTWRIKVLRVVFTVAVVGALAMASGANYLDYFWDYLW